MSSLSFQTPLTPEEKRLYGEQFRKLDEEELGIVTGEALKPLFAGSGLSGQKLSQVWSLVDENNNGFLNLEEYSAALRAIGHLQQYPNLPVTGDLYAHPPAKLAVLDGAQAGVQSGNQQPSTSIPILAPQDVSKYSQLFERAANGAVSLPGDKAKEIFLKARLPTQTLGEIWGLCDRNASGSLDKAEFVMAMHLIQLCMSNNPSVNPMPHTLPSQLWNTIGASVAATVSPLSANSTGRSSLGRRSTISRLSSGVFNSASTDWSLTFEKKQQFDAIFDSLDKSHKGSLDSQALVPFFLSSRLNQDTLASIWDLADIHNNAEFTKVEFAIAMFLIQKRNAGVELPDVIPDQLLQSPALGLYQQQQPAHQLHQQVPQQQPNIAIPSRNTKPSFQEAPQPQITQNSNNGSLSELLALNSSFASPSSQTPVRRNSSNFGREAPSTGAAAAHQTRSVPGKADWNPNVIREDDEDAPQSQNLQQQPQQLQQQPQQLQQQPQQLQQQPQQLQQQPQQLQQQPQQLQQQPQQPQQQPQQQQYQQSTQVQQAQYQNVPQPVSKSAPPAVVPRASWSNLPKVPDFSSFALPGAIAGAAGAAGALMAGAAAASGHRNNDLYADAEASSQLSSATTEMANLSNQVNSLSKQASLTNERKARAEKELKRVNEMKSAIQGKLSTLRSTHEQNVKQTEQLEADLATINRENETLNQQLAVVEGNYHATETKLRDLSEEFQQAQDKNSQLKEQISSLNAMSATLQSQLAEKQQHVKQERSLIDVNGKQLEVNQMTVANFQSEIQGLDEKLTIYLTKRKELDDYQKTVEDQHAQLQSKYQELEAGNSELKAREQELAQRTEQVEEQEKLYEQHVERLQRMFEDLSKRKESLDRAEEDLEKQHFEYASKVQELSDRQMKLAMGELPSDSGQIVSRSAVVPNTKHDADISKFVEDSVANSKLSNPGNEDEDRAESEVFDKDVPTTGSQTEADEELEARAPVSHAETAVTLADGFESDLNEYGIPRTQSLTSSVANNPPHSVMDDAELPQKLDETSGANVEDKDLTVAAAQIPGHWEEATVSTAGTTKHEIIPKNPSEKPLDKPVGASDQLSDKNIGSVPEEVLPIENLKLNEEEASSSNDEFEDTREDLNPHAGQSVRDSPVMLGGQAASYQVPSETPATVATLSTSTADAAASPARDAFDDAFTGLQQAADEEAHAVGDEQQITESIEEFEKIEHKDLDEELQQNAFTGTLTSEATVRAKDTNNGSDNTSNDEWDEIFAGFGNGDASAGSKGIAKDTQQQHPIPIKPNEGYSSSPVNRKLATTPRSLAVEELSGMGFTEQEATSALEQCNWDLEAATNFLLDNA
ncbi:hypothetical protein HG536_0B03690 [Torulaspora globosa]|uniref:Actin cytoskeleton-regulatory complex protein PAN1 n=1 Tax=Torulaspora globosa TaxID=48254 RepID=A0A7G3ZDC0_9SACH|nr:uncharacterized protein HG536_0B03690 [Torulaspora globosa]QLL31506.1 hypothetical protein HG536_0B03690 [Torulaspora globosa]